MYQYGTQLPRTKCIKQEEEGIIRNNRSSTTWRPLPTGLGVDKVTNIQALITHVIAAVIGAMFGMVDITHMVRDMQDGDTLTVYPDAALFNGLLPGTYHVMRALACISMALTQRFKSLLWLSCSTTAASAYLPVCALLSCLRIYVMTSCQAWRAPRRSSV